VTDQKSEVFGDCRQVLLKSLRNSLMCRFLKTRQVIAARGRMSRNEKKAPLSLREREKKKGVGVIQRRLMFREDLNRVVFFFLRLW